MYLEEAAEFPLILLTFSFFRWRNDHVTLGYLRKLADKSFFALDSLRSKAEAIYYFHSLYEITYIEVFESASLLSFTRTKSFSLY